MSWVKVDVEEIRAVGELTAQVTQDVINAYNRLRGLGGSALLGSSAATVQVEASAVASLVEGSVTTVLVEVIDTLKRAIALVSGEQTADVAFGLQGPATALGVGATVGAFGAGVSVVGGSGPGFGPLVPAAGLGTSVVGGTGPGFGLMEPASSLGMSVVGGPNSASFSPSESGSSGSFVVGGPNAANYSAQPMPSMLGPTIVGGTNPNLVPVEMKINTQLSGPYLLAAIAAKQGDQNTYNAAIRMQNSAADALTNWTLPSGWSVHTRYF